MYLKQATPLRLAEGVEERHGDSMSQQPLQQHSNVLASTPEEVSILVRHGQSH